MAGNLADANVGYVRIVDGVRPFDLSGCHFTHESLLLLSTESREKVFFWIWRRPRYKIPEFFTTALTTLTVCRRNRGDPSYLYRT